MTTSELQALGWESIAPGWWHHKVHGGIVKERDGKWWRYSNESWLHSDGPFDTLWQAVAETDDRP
jgi:hypothetical protein